MEHSCQQCGTAVEDGRAFCPQCRAPQIHVQIAIPDAAVGDGLGSLPDESSLEDEQPGHSDRRMLSGKTLDSRIATGAALKAGLLGVLIGAIPFIGILLTGALAVVFYRRKSGLTLPAALGARVGGAAGVVLFGIGALATIAIVVMHAQQQCVDLWMTMLQRLGANTASPQIQASIRDLFTASGQAISFIVSVVSASVGGALASLLLRPRKPRV